MNALSRRDVLNLFLKGILGLAGGLGLAELIRYFNFQIDPAPPTEFDLGPADDFLIGRYLFPHIPALLIRDKDGFRAMSLSCTHLGCTVEQTENGFVCPCHGSRYDQNGNVLQGPAKKPLQMLRLEVTDEGHLRLSLK